MISKITIIASSTQTPIQIDPTLTLKSKKLTKHSQSCSSAPLHLPSISPQTLKLVLLYCQHYNTTIPVQIPKPIQGNTLNGVIDPWDQQFINLHPRQLIELVNAAEELEVHDLVELCAAKIAVLMKSMGEAQIRRDFGIVHEFTAEEEEQMRRQNQWATII